MKHFGYYFLIFIYAAAVGTAAALLLYIVLNKGTVVQISSGAGPNSASLVEIVSSPVVTNTPMPTISTSLTSYCNSQTIFADETGKQVCSRMPRSFTKKSVEIDLTKMRLYYYESGILQKEYAVISKGNPLKWWRTPTGDFKIMRKETKLWSSRFPVLMPWSVQFYEDFFIHGIPKYEDGSDVPLGFSGGCLRLSDADAKDLFSRVDIGTRVYVYDNDLAILQSEGTLVSPVDLAKVWIRQSFNSPHYIADRRGENDKYVNHTGVDLAPDFDVQDSLAVNVIGNGKVALVQKNGEEDHGFGNAIIIERSLWVVKNDALNSSSSPWLLENKKVYSLYAHLDSFAKEFAVGDAVQKGEILGIMGASGYGCQTFWRVGTDGCESKNPPDTHLHFEIKTAPVMTNPEGGDVCIYLKNGTET